MPAERKLRWWLIRHAPTDPAFRGRIMGQTDVSIAPLAPAESLGAFLPDEALWLVTPLRRTQETAIALGRNEWQVIPAFMEQRFGRWEGNRWSELLERDASAAAFLADYSQIAPPLGESLTDVSRRCVAAFERLTADTVASNLVAVVHAGVIRCLVAHVLDMPLSSAMKLSIDHLSLTSIECWGDERQVLGVNWKLGQIAK